MEGQNPDIGEQSIRKLMDTLDSFDLPEERTASNEPMLAIEKVYMIKGLSIVLQLLMKSSFLWTGRGTVVTGKLHHGTMKKGDKMQVVGMGKDAKCTISGDSFFYFNYGMPTKDVEMFRKTVDKGEAGDQLGK
jgi:elongation factor Tu